MAIAPTWAIEQVEEAGAADFGDVVVGGDQEIGGQRHGFPGHHEQVGVIGEKHQRHAGEEYMVFEAQQAEGVARHVAEIACRIKRNADAGSAEQQQEKCGQRIQAQMEGQVGQAERQHRNVGGAAQAAQCGGGQDQCAQGAGRENKLRDDARVVLQQQARQAQQQPIDDDAQGDVDGQHGRNYWHELCYSSILLDCRAIISQVFTAYRRRQCACPFSSDGIERIGIVVSSTLGVNGFQRHCLRWEKCCSGRSGRTGRYGASRRSPVFSGR